MQELYDFNVVLHIGIGEENTNKSTHKDRNQNWLSDLTGLESNEKKTTICACGKWYIGTQHMK